MRLNATNCSHTEYFSVQSYLPSILICHEECSGEEERVRRSQDMLTAVVRANHIRINVDDINIFPRGAKARDILSGRRPCHRKWVYDGRLRSTSGVVPW
jgi:hypothetical protein